MAHAGNRKIHGLAHAGNGKTHGLARASSEIGTADLTPHVEVGRAVDTSKTAATPQVDGGKTDGTADDVGTDAAKQVLAKRMLALKTDALEAALLKDIFKEASGYERESRSMVISELLEFQAAARHSHYDAVELSDTARQYMSLLLQAVGKLMGLQAIAKKFRHCDEMTPDMTLNMRCRAGEIKVKASNTFSWCIALRCSTCLYRMWSLALYCPCFACALCEAVSVSCYALHSVWHLIIFDFVLWVRLRGRVRIGQDMYLLVRPYGRRGRDRRVTPCPC